MALTGSGNFTTHPTKEKVLKEIETKIEMLKPLPPYLQRDITVMSWNELREYNAELKVELQIRTFGHPI